MQPQTPTTTPAVDMDALTLAHAIALTESGTNGKPNYDAKGKSNEHGAYQWLPGNFESAAKEAGLNPSDFSPKNQDKVAYYQIKKYKDQGYKPYEIAALWNSGDPNGYKNHKGVNAEGVPYDTPKYVENVKNNYMSLKKQKTVGSMLSPTPTTDQPTTSDQAKSASNPLVDYLTKGVAGLGVDVPVGDIVKKTYDTYKKAIP